MGWRDTFAVFLCVCLTAFAVVVGTVDRAWGDTWRERKADVEWAFKLGAVSVALEKCPFKKGSRFEELAANARDVARADDARSQEEGRQHMMILDGPDLSALCGTAFKFFGPAGRDLSGVLDFDPVEPAKSAEPGKASN